MYSYDTSIQPIENVWIVTAATAYDDVTTGDTTILVFNESLVLYRSNAGLGEIELA